MRPGRQDSTALVIWQYAVDLTIAASMMSAHNAVMIGNTSMPRTGTGSMPTRAGVPRQRHERALPL